MKELSQIAVLDRRAVFEIGVFPSGKHGYTWLW